MSIPIGITTENAGHTHTITNPGTGFTDPAEDGHKHGLIKGCAACQKARAMFKVETIPTTYLDGHLHFMNSGSLI
jgi:hypothetical protein